MKLKVYRIPKYLNFSYCLRVALTAYRDKQENHIGCKFSTKSGKEIKKLPKLKNLLEQLQINISKEYLDFLEKNSSYSILRESEFFNKWFNVFKEKEDKVQFLVNKGLVNDVVYSSELNLETFYLVFSSIKDDKFDDYLSWLLK